jgi:CHAT domain-containing protein
MARKWTAFLSAVHTVLNQKRWQRFVLVMVLGGAIALTTPFILSPPIQAQPDPTDLVEQGQDRYEAGNYNGAVESLEGAIEAFGIHGQPLQEAITRSNLALVYQARRQEDNAGSDSKRWYAEITKGFDLLNVPLEVIATDTLPEIDVASLRIFAALLNVYGKGMLQGGDAAQALAAWQQADQAYQAVGDREGEISSQINQLQALQLLGLFKQASDLGQQIHTTIKAQANPAIKTKGLLNLGDIERAIGQLSQSEVTLQAAFKAAESLKDEAELIDDEAKITREHANIISEIELSLGRTQQALGDRETERLYPVNRQGLSPWTCSFVKVPESAVPYYQTALEHYLDVSTNSQDPTQKVTAQLNRLAILLTMNRFDILQDDWPQKPQLSELPHGREQVFAAITLAQRGACLKQAIIDEDTSENDDGVSWGEIQELLTTAMATAETLDDRVAKSYARGSLGGLYEYFADLETTSQGKVPEKADVVWRQTSRDLTEQALFLAQPSELPDIAYQWQWQLARLQKAEGNEKGAIAYYKQAVETLEAVRGNLRTVDSDVQFSFRDNAEPVYRELVDLLLKPDTPSQDDLEEAIRYIDTLQLSELENFLQCSLATVELTETVVDTSAANVYGIVLNDRIEVILARPEQPLQRTRHFIAQTDLVDRLETLQDNLRSPAGTSRAKLTSIELYNWMIRPFESVLDAETELERSDVKVLTFVLDTSLRSVPMGVLYDDQRDRYLLERYAIATVPSLRVVEPEPLSRQLSIFAGGTSEELQHPFRDITLNPLEEVKAELAAIQAIFPDGEYSLVNEAFTTVSVERTLERNVYPVVHIATHGEFSSDPERTFILLSDKHLNAREIDNLLRARSQQSGIQLLVLSACKTATGDKRATLGLAGLTVRAGSRSTLATLWQVDDASTAALMEGFYQMLKEHPEISKVEALRQSQLAVRADPDHSWESPLHWAPFIMVGNWQ